ncbi:MAG: cytochrome c oxidase subunit 3 [Acidimicrobiales bacterium]
MSDILLTSASSFILLTSSLPACSPTMPWCTATTRTPSSLSVRDGASARCSSRGRSMSSRRSTAQAFHDGNLFGSAFYTLTGFHGIHVTVGILMLVALVIMANRGKLQADRAETVELVGLY